MWTNNKTWQNIILMKLTSLYRYNSQNKALVGILGHVNCCVDSVKNRPLIPNFDTIRKSWNDFCSVSVIFLFHPHWHLKSLSGSNSQSQSFPYISSSFLASASSIGSIPYHFSLISGIHQHAILVNLEKMWIPALDQKLLVIQLWNDLNGIMIVFPNQKQQ